MITNELENIITETIRKKVLGTKMEFFEKVNKEIEASRERESKVDDVATKEFHKGIQAGMTHVLILLTNLNL